MAEDYGLNEFLDELSKLTVKYGWEIGGCGCCGSPFINKKLNKQLVGSYSVGDVGGDEVIVPTVVKNEAWAEHLSFTEKS